MTSSLLKPDRPTSSGTILRPLQMSAIEWLRYWLAAGFLRVMLMASCGFGKTVIACEITRCAVAKGVRVLFIVDRLELLDQASARLDLEGIPHGVMQGNHWRWRPWEMVQVCSIQTLARRKKPEFGLAIIDEAHVLHGAHKRLMAECDVPFIGLSATPFTRGLGRHFQKLVVGASTQTLIDEGLLVEPRVFAPSGPDLEKVRIRAGDFDEGQLGEAINKPKLIADVPATYLRLAHGKQALGFAVNIAHSKALVERFEESGVTAAHVDSYTPMDERKEIIKRFRSGQITVLFNVGILDKGFDFPEIEVLIMARPTASLTLYIQQAGRILRTAEGKTDALILDHAGNTERHGFVTDPLPEDLDMGEKRAQTPRQRKEPLPKACPQCSLVKPPQVHKCAACGFSPERQSAVDHVDGDLAEITKTQRRNARTFTLPDKAAFFGQLVTIGTERGYKPGWAAHRYRMKFGVWPSHPAIRNAEPLEPSPEVRSWVRGMDIRNAKARRTREAAA